MLLKISVEPNQNQRLGSFIIKNISAEQYSNRTLKQSKNFSLCDLFIVLSIPYNIENIHVGTFLDAERVLLCTFFKFGNHEKIKKVSLVIFFIIKKGFLQFLSYMYCMSIFLIGV